MILLFDIALPKGTEYVSLAPTAIDYGGNPYDNIVISVEGFSENQGEDKSYEVSPLTITMFDLQKKFRNAFVKQDDNRYFMGATVTARQEDGTALRITKIDEFDFPEKKFVIICSLKADMGVKFTELITSDLGSWSPNVSEEAINNVVPMAYNTITEMVAWMVDDRPSYHDYLLGISPISTITAIWKKTQNWDSRYWSLSDDGTYYYVAMPHGVIGQGERYCLASITTAAKTPVEIIDHALTGKIGVGANADFKTFIAAEGYDATNTRYLVDREMTPAELLGVFCKCFECHYRIDATGDIIFTWIDPDNISTVRDYVQEEILGEIEQIRPYDADYIINQIYYEFDKKHSTGEYNSNVTFDGANQADWGKRKKYEVQYEFLTEAVQAAVTAGRTYELNKEPTAVYRIAVPDLDNIGYYPGDLIRVSHSDLKAYPNPILFVIRRKELGPTEDKIYFEIEDIDWLEPTFYLIDEIEYYITDEVGRKIICR